AAAYQFEIQAQRLFLSIVHKLTNYRYVVRDETKGAELTVMVLASTFDFYEYRMNRGRQRVQLLVVQNHNAVAPLPVICLTDSQEYDPGQAPRIERPDAKRPN